MISEEVFTQALLLTHTYDPNVPPSQRLQAERYLVELRSHHEGLQLAFYLIGDRPLPAEQQQQQQMAIRELQYFWAFNTILEQLPGCSEALRNDGAQAEQLLGRLLDFLQRSFAECAVRPIAEYVMNKHAQLMDAGLQLLYPAQWGSFFDQLFALRAHYCTYAAQADPRHAVHSPSQENHNNSNNNNNNISTSGSASACSSPQPAETYGNNNNNNNITSNNGEEMAMMNGQQQQSGRSSGRSVREMATMYVLRVFEYIDERVVGDRAQPGPEREQRTRNMAVKDALRERVMPMAVEVWCEILSVQHAELMQQANTTSSSSSSNNSSVSMARLCLSVMQSYVAWIDIKLLLTPAWMNLLYSLLALPPLRAEATEVLLALVTKKQLPGTKLDTLARLRISEVVEALVNSLVVRMKQTGHGTGGSEAHTMYSSTTGPGAAGYLVAENSNTNNANGSALFGPPTHSVSSHDARGGAEVWGEEDEAFESVVSRLTMAVAEQFLQLLELLTNNTDSSSMSAGMSSEENNMQAGGYRHGGLAAAPRGSGASGEDEEANHGLRAAHGYSDGSHDSLSHLASPRSARSLAGSASPYNTRSSNNNNNNNAAAAAAVAAAAAAAAAAANGVQDIAFDLTPQLLQNLSDVLHGCVAHLLRLLKLVNLYDLRDEFLPFIQSYVKSPALLPEEAAELLYTLFDQTRLSRINTAEEDGGEQGEEDGEGHEGRVQNAYVASQGYSPNSYALDKNNTMGGVANKYNTAVRDTSSDVLVERYEDRIWDEAVTTQRKALHNLIRLLYRRQPQLVLEHLQAYVERITSTTTSSNNNSTAEEDADEVEAVLRYFYEMGEAVKLDCLREMDHPFTQLLTRIVTADIIAQHASSLVHLAFFEVLDRYYVFFTMHREYIAVLLHRLLLLPCGVVNRRARVRARICYLFSHLLSVLKTCLVPYAKDMVLALQSILTSVPSLVLPNDARQLYEATGVLLRVLFTNASSAMQANTNDNSNNNNNNTTVDGACAMHSSNNNNSGGTSHMSGSPSNAMTSDNNNNNAHNGQKSFEATYASNHNAGSAAAAAGEDEMRASCALLESVSEQAVGALHTVSHRITTVSARDAMITTSQSLSPLSSPHSTRTYETKESAEAHSIDAIADAISYLTALAKGLGGLSMNESNNSNNNSNNTQGGGASRSLGSSPPTNTTTTTSSSTSNACLATTTTDSSSNVCGEVVMRVYLSMTQEVMLSSQHWHAASVVREATGQFFHQMVNTVPYDGLVPYLAQYIADCLAAMEFVPELTKLLRLLYQCISRTGAAAAALIVDVLPALWSKLSEVGALSEAAPVISMGVMSESAREKVEVYRQFFALLHGAAAKGCARALLVNVPLLRAVLDELMHALELPAELELPRLAVQTFTRLAIECTTMMMAAAAAAAANGGGENEETCATQRQGNTTNNSGSNSESPRRGGADTRDSPGASSALVSSSTSAAAAAAAAAAASTAEQQAMFLEYCVQSVLPQALAVFFRPQFDLKDAKHFMLIGEIGLLCKAVVQAYGEAALQVMYTCLVKPLGETGAMTFCVTVRDAPQMSAAVKAKLRQLLAQRMT